MCSSPFSSCPSFESCRSWLLRHSLYIMGRWVNSCVFYYSISFLFYYILLIITFSYFLFYFHFLINFSVLSKFWIQGTIGHIMWWARLCLDSCIDFKSPKHGAHWIFILSTDDLVPFRIPFFAKMSLLNFFLYHFPTYSLFTYCIFTFPPTSYCLYHMSYNILVTQFTLPSFSDVSNNSLFPNTPTPPLPPYPTHTHSSSPFHCHHGRLWIFSLPLSPHPF